MQIGEADLTVVKPIAERSQGENQVQMKGDFEVSLSEEEDEGCSDEETELHDEKEDKKEDAGVRKKKGRNDEWPEIGRPMNG